MKFFNLLLAISFFSLFIALSSCNQTSENVNVSEDSITSENNVKSDFTIEVYNFHRTNRCQTCTAIGESGKKAVNNYFFNEKEQGIVKFNDINLDDEVNNKLAEKFEATGSSLYILTKNKDNETIENLTEFAFLTAVDQPDMLIEAIKTNIQEKLNQMSKKPNV